MKKTAFILMITSAMGIALNAEIAAEYKPFEDAISKNNSDALKALASVYQNNKLTLPVDVKARIVALASKELSHQQAIKPRIFLPALRIVSLLIGAGLCCGPLATIYKTLWPSDQNLPHGWTALKDLNNANLLAAMSCMVVGGIVFPKSVYDERYREARAQEQENSATLRNATEVLNILQKFPTTA